MQQIQYIHVFAFEWSALNGSHPARRWAIMKLGLIRRQRAGGYMGQAEPVLEVLDQVLLVATPLRDSQHLLVAAGLFELFTTIQ